MDGGLSLACVELIKTTAAQCRDVVVDETTRLNSLNHQTSHWPDQKYD
jgi:hypothetical protein